MNNLYRETFDTPKNIIKSNQSYMVLRKLSENHLPIKSCLTLTKARMLVKELELISDSTFVIGKEVE